MNETKNISERGWLWLIGVVSVVVVATVALLLVQSQDQSSDVANTQIYLLPKLNAVLNSLTFLCLLVGFYFIKNQMINAHKRVMISAFIFSVFFLVSYITYHYAAPHTSFGGSGFIQYVYYFILITHILLAIAVVPLALITFFRAWKMDYQKHKKIARWTLPIWLYVSITGVVVYLMIAPYYPL